MTRSVPQAVLFLIVCPLLAAQQPSRASAPSTIALAVSAVQSAADVPQSGAALNHAEILKNARTIHISSETAFLTVGTMERSLMKQKDWEKLGLNIVENPGSADLQLRIDRLIFTHIHTYVLTDRRTSIVLASGRVTAFDGIVASGPMAGQIVKILSMARVPKPAQGM
jgi:hypothetical protein